MKDVEKGLRLALHTALNGNVTYDSISVPFSDEEYKGAAPRYVIYSTQTSRPVERNDSTWITRATILLDIIQKTDAVSKDGLDDIAHAIMEIVMPTTQTIGITAPAGFQYTNLEVSDSRSLNLQLSSNSSITRKLLTFSLDIIQQ